MPVSSRAVLVEIDDAILRVDVESVLVGAGYQVVTLQPAGALPDDQAFEFALIDADPPSRGKLQLIRTVTARGIPCLLFTSDETDDIIYGQPVARLAKPFASDELLTRVAQVLAGPQ